VIDPDSEFMLRLYEENCEAHFINHGAYQGFFVKTLRVLNRDPSSVIFLDVRPSLTQVNPLSVSRHSQNAFIVPTLSHGNHREEGYLRNLIEPLMKLSLLANPIPVQKHLESIMSSIAADARMSDVPLEVDMAHRRNIYRLQDGVTSSLQGKNPFLKFPRKVPEGALKKSRFCPDTVGEKPPTQITSGFSVMVSKAKSTTKSTLPKKPIDYHSIGAGSSTAKLFADAHLEALDAQNNQLVPSTPLSRNAKKEFEKDLTRVLEEHNDPQRIQEERSSLAHELTKDIYKKFKGKA
jgi:hypothetical protein